MPALSDLGIAKLYIEKKQTKFRKIHPRKFFCSNPYSGDNTTNYAGEVESYKVYDLKDMFPENTKMIEEFYPDPQEVVEVYEVFKSGIKSKLYIVIKLYLFIKTGNMILFLMNL